MKSQRKILTAFLLNLFFSVIEFIGGTITGSVAIISDSIHDLGDSISIGISYFLEKLSQKKPDKKFTYGYLRFSVLGSVITTVILISGSILVTYNAILRIIHPVEINYNGMIVLGVFGVVINFAAAYFTSGGSSLNQKAVNLHMLEDVLGWIAVLIGAVVMRFTNLRLIDPLMSIGISVFIFVNAIKNLKAAMDIFLEKVPIGIDTDKITDEILKIDGVEDVHHLHLRSIDPSNHLATMHIVTSKDTSEIKHQVKHILSHYGINHSTVETETKEDSCDSHECQLETETHENHHHHH